MKVAGGRNVRRGLLNSASSSQNEDVNSCRTEVLSDGCSQQRTCRSCMASSLRDQGLSCYLETASGQCSSFGELAPPQTTLNNVTSIGKETRTTQELEASGIYSSTTRHYCSLSDQACSLCRTLGDYPRLRLSPGQLKTVSADRTICYGESGCICAAACESSQWLDQAGARCPSNSVYPYKFSSSMGWAPPVWAVMGAVVLLQLVIAAIFLVRRQRRCHETQRDDRANKPSRAYGDVQAVKLQGWSTWDEHESDSGFVNLQDMPPLPLATRDLEPPSIPTQHGTN